MRLPADWREGCEWLFYLAGIACLAAFAGGRLEGCWAQAWEGRRLAATAVAAGRGEGGAAAAQAGAPALGGPIARLVLPRIGLDAVVLEGAEPAILRRGIGHVVGTALPGEPGNVGLAAHRDSFFRDLGQVRPGDEVRLVTPRGTYSYEVVASVVVAPEATHLLRSGPRGALTLITCYPFQAVGPAPRRFVVRALATTAPRWAP